jgi:FkbM family methyltransferase
MRYAGRTHYVRLNSTDPLVWFSVFHQQDYRLSLPFEPRVIVDAGAYIGLSSVYLAVRYPTARVFAVEPDPDNFALLSTNTQSYPAIRPIHAALWSEDTRVSVQRQPGEDWGCTVTPCATAGQIPSSPQQVSAMTLESLTSRFHITDVDLLKVDVEGAEKEIFARPFPWSDRIGAIAIEVHDRLHPGCSAVLDAATQGFERSEVSPMTSLLVNPRWCINQREHRLD